MPYQFTPVRVGVYTDHFDALNGDLGKVENFDRSIEIGVNPPERRAAMVCGRAVKQTWLPTRFRPNGRRRALPDIVGFQIGRLCSHALRDVFESFERVHAFYPVTFEWKRGATTNTHCIMVPQRALRALHPKKAVPPKPEPNARWLGCLHANQAKSKKVLSKEIIGDAHFWSDPQMFSQWYVSDDLGAALEAARLTGFTLTYCEAA